MRLFLLLFSFLCFAYKFALFILFFLPFSLLSWLSISLPSLSHTSPRTLAKAFIVSAHIFLFFLTLHTPTFLALHSFLSLPLSLSFLSPLHLFLQLALRCLHCIPSPLIIHTLIPSNRAQLGTLEASSSTLLPLQHSTTTTQGEAHTNTNTFNKGS